MIHVLKDLVEKVDHMYEQMKYFSRESETIII